jgi:type VI secretion system secreted protein VgrG
VYTETLASRKVNAGGDRHEKFGAAGSYKIGGTTTIKGSEVVVEATAKITLQASGITITITPASVTIDGAYKGSGESSDSGKEDYD